MFNVVPTGPRVVAMSDSDLTELTDQVWAATLADDPLDATATGHRGYDALLPDNDPDAADAAERRWQRLAAAVRGLPQDGPARTDRSALLSFVDTQLAMQLPRHAAWNVDPMAGPVMALCNSGERQPVADPRQRAQALDRHRAMAPYLDRYGAGLRRALADGLVAPAVLVRRVIGQIDGVLATPPADSPLLAPAAAAGDDGFAAALAATVDGETLPALARLRATLAQEILPRARPDDRAGLGALPGGPELYARAVRGFTTLELTARQVHEVGLAEVARADAALAELGARALGASGLADTLERLRGGAGVGFRDREEVLDVTRDAVARAEEAVPDFFGLRHRQPCVVRPAPAHEEGSAPFAYYWPPSADGAHPGTFYVNTSAPEGRPRYDVVTDACHEAVPGHHLQFDVARQLPGLPPFRGVAAPPVYTEGWALYAEQLGEEMGVHRTDLDRLGRLVKDAVRCARLVVDTGLHALGWTRAEAVAHLVAHTALGPAAAEREVDRYLAWPGQALSYKLGQREIVALREGARARPGFDLRRFHDAVLGSGILPLGALREVVLPEMGGTISRGR
jgi:uncharacterized protein (DUF885 family)